MPNIDLQPDFGENLRARRLAVHLSESELAAKAGLTYRTVRELETGRRRRVMERTLLALAAALDVTAEDLAGVIEPAPRRRPPLRVFALIALVAAAAGLFSLTHYARTRAELDVDTFKLTANDAVLGLPLWELHSTSSFRFCGTSRWDPAQVIAGLGAEAPGGGRLFCLDRASGDTAWVAEPDHDALIAAFGADIVKAANFNCTRVDWGDVDGDGKLEAIALFLHGIYYPAVVCVFEDDGRLRSQYANKGHINALLVVDLDQDGAAEIVASGTNNDPSYQGATAFVLANGHASGASIDSLANSWSTVRDSSLVRIILPQFRRELMDVAEAPRLHGQRLQAFTGVDGSVLLRMEVQMGPDVVINVTLNSDLVPVGARLSDTAIRHIVAAWPEDLAREMLNEVNLYAWLDRGYRYGSAARD
jgi:transcriptional regulator with XRE-family HTH domain